MPPRARKPPGRSTPCPWHWRRSPPAGHPARRESRHPAPARRWQHSPRSRRARWRPSPPSWRARSAGRSGCPPWGVFHHSFDVRLCIYETREIIEKSGRFAFDGVPRRSLTFARLALTRCLHRIRGADGERQHHEAMARCAEDASAKTPCGGTTSFTASACGPRRREVCRSWCSTEMPKAAHAGSPSARGAPTPLPQLARRPRNSSGTPTRLVRARQSIRPNASSRSATPSPSRSWPTSTWRRRGRA